MNIMLVLNMGNPMDKKPDVDMTELDQGGGARTTAGGTPKTDAVLNLRDESSVSHKAKLIKLCRELECGERLFAEKYYELLYAVSKKYPDESRHQTALRYIQQAEKQFDGTAQRSVSSGED